MQKATTNSQRQGSIHRHLAFICRLSIEYKIIRHCQNHTEFGTHGLDYDKLNIKVAPSTTAEMWVEFSGETLLVVRAPFNYTKEYRINRIPYSERDTIKMVLNGVVLYKKN
jgi:hypothetical protein